MIPIATGRVSNPPGPGVLGSEVTAVVLSISIWSKEL